MIHSVSGPIPKHQYVWIQPNAIGEHDWIRAVWFGIQSLPGRMWGCHVMLESCGAVYRNIPLHHLAAYKGTEDWMPCQAQVWDCYGTDFTVVEYPFLKSMRGHCRFTEGSEATGEYLFSVVPTNDGWSEEPSQAKEFFFMQMDNGRFAALPTNAVLFQDASVGTKAEWPTFLKRQKIKWSAEE